MKTQITRRFAAPAVVGAALIAGLLAPTAAQAAGTGAQTTEATVVAVDATGQPVAGQTVTVDAAWPELLPGGASFAENTEGQDYLDAQARFDAAAKATASWFTAQDRPAQRAYDTAYQRYLAGTGSLAQWQATWNAQSAEMRATQAKYDATDIAAENLAASKSLATEKAEMLAEATEVRRGETDASGSVQVAPALGGGVAWPTVTVGATTKYLPMAPSSTTTLSID